MRYQLLLQDCLDGMRNLKDESVGVVITSPPYNIGKQYNRDADDLPRLEYLDWTTRWITEVSRILHPNGSFFLNIGGKPTDPVVPYQVLGAALMNGFKLQNTIHWVKSMSYDLLAGEPCEGHVKPLNSGRFLNDAHEFVFHLSKEGYAPLDRTAEGVSVRYADESNLKRGTRGKNGNARCAGNVWHLPYSTIQNGAKDRPHPATFPVELPDRLIRLVGVDNLNDWAGTDGWAVLDPFSGIGTTGWAALQLGASFIGYETDPDYWQVGADTLRVIARERV